MSHAACRTTFRNSVVASIDGDPTGASQAHAVTVSEMRFDSVGKLETVIMNDTGSDGGCGKETSGKSFSQGLIAGKSTNVVPPGDPMQPTAG